MDSNKFNEHCNTINDINIRVFGVPLDKEVFYDKDKLRKVFRKLSKETHPDTGQEAYKDGGVSQDLNDAYHPLKAFIEKNPNHSYSIIYTGEKLDKRSLLENLKSYEKHYEPVSKEYLTMYENFERMVYFEKEKDYSVYAKEYNKIITKLENLMYTIEKCNELRNFIEPEDVFSYILVFEFESTAKKCKSKEQIDEIYKNYLSKIKINFNYFHYKKQLTEEYKGYPEEYFLPLISSFDSEIGAKNIADLEEVGPIFKKYIDLIKEKKSIVDYYLKIEKIVSENKNINLDAIDINDILDCQSKGNAKEIYDRLKEKIDYRIEFSQKVKQKLQTFLIQYQKKEEYSYTYPFIQKLIKPFYKYYDPSDNNLEKLEGSLKSIMPIIERQKNIDLNKADIKKERLRLQFKTDFDNGIFIGDNYPNILDKLGEINTFGGFANFENYTISLEISKVLTSVILHLKNSQSKLKKEEDSKLVLSEIDRALKLVCQVERILKNTKNYKIIQVNPEKQVPYRKFALMLQILKNIDFYNDNLEKIDAKLGTFDEFLNKEVYDRQLEEIVGRKK